MNSEAEDRSHDPNLAELDLMYGLSVRAFNVCEGADFNRLSDIRAFYEMHNGFESLRNCGAKTVIELETMLMNSASLPGTADPTAMPSRDGQLDLIYRAHVHQLSTEARNALRALVGNMDGNAGIGFFMRNGKKLHMMNGVNGAVRRELRRMRISLFNYVEQIREGKGTGNMEEPGSPLYRWALSHSISPALLEFMFDEAGRMTLFRFMAHYLKDLDDKTAHRIVVAYLEGKGQTEALSEIGDTYSVTRERVRQILTDVNRRLNHLFHILHDLPDVREHYPELTTSDPVFIIAQELMDRLNEKENTNWSSLFALHITKAISEHDQIVEPWTALLGKSKLSKGLEVKHPVLIHRELIEPLKPLLAEMTRQYELNRKAPEEFDLLTLLKVEHPAQHLPLLEALRLLASICYPGIRITGDRCVLPANKLLFNEDRLVAVLENLDKPSHASVIVEEWVRSFPDHAINIEGVRSTALRNKDLFISFGRTSTYGLKRWEEERPELKGGTIRGIISDLLGSVNIPLHLEELEEGVKRYRPETNLHSISQNLKLDSSGEFVHFPGGFVGLANKVYGEMPDPLARVPGSLLRDNILAKFIGQPRSRFSAYLASKCQASPSRVERAIDNTVVQGRLVIDASGIIRSAEPRLNDPGTRPGELPFDD